MQIVVVFWWKDGILMLPLTFGLDECYYFRCALREEFCFATLRSKYCEHLPTRKLTVWKNGFTQELYNYYSISSIASFQTRPRPQTGNPAIPSASGGINIALYGENVARVHLNCSMKSLFLS